MTAKTWKHEELFLRLMLVVLFIGIQIYYYNISPTFQQSEITDTDSFTRLVRVEKLASTGDWYDSFNERSNAPYGESQHWTRPLDVLLLIGGWALTPFFGFHQGLLLWGIIFNPLLGAFTLFILHRLISPYFDIQGQRLVDLLFFCQIATWETYIIGHPDHHGLIITLFIILLCLLFRMVDEKQPDTIGLWAGLAAGAGFWISVESITAIILVFAALGYFWLREGGIYLKRLTHFNLVLLLSLIVFLLVERPLTGILVVEYDKISSVHIFVFALSLAALFVLKKLSAIGWKNRLLTIIPVGLASLAIIWLTFPDFFGGPFVRVNKAIIPIWLSKVNEVQPLMSDPSTLYMLIMNLILCGISLFFLIKTQSPLNKNITIPLIIGLILFLPLSFYQLRWYRYASMLLFLIVSLGLQLLSKITTAIQPLLRQRLVRVLMILIFCISPLATSLFINNKQDNEPNLNYPPLRSISQWLDLYPGRFPAETIILTNVDFGPEILYRTKFQVISTPYHRNDGGILFVHQVMQADDEQIIKKMLEKRSIRFVLISPGSIEEKFIGQDSDFTFYNRLNRNQLPNWLRPIPLPLTIAKDFKLFEIHIQ